MRAQGVLAGAAAGLSLAAAPAFAAMALLVAASGGGPAGGLCAAMPGLLRLDGMAAMYALMALFHLGPWLRRAGGRPATRPPP